MEYDPTLNLITGWGEWLEVIDSKQEWIMG